MNDLFRNRSSARDSGWTRDGVLRLNVEPPRNSDSGRRFSLQRFFLQTRVISAAMFPFITCAWLCLVKLVASSTLTSPPQSAVVIAFEDIYDASLLANTLSDQGIDATLIIPSSEIDDLYENLIDVEVLKLDVGLEESVTVEVKAVRACEKLWKDAEIARIITEIQPTFVIFPALRHDACLIPWARHIASMPVVWTRNSDEEVYVFESTGVAIPIQNAGFWTRLTSYLHRRSVFSVTRDEYEANVLRVVEKYFPNSRQNLENPYVDVHLILWGADTILRSDFASLTQLLVEVGCHHCRGPHPLPGELQKSLVEFRLGTIVSLLDENYEGLLRELAKKIPQGREGHAIVWKIKNWKNEENVLPENVFVTTRTDRQDLIGYGRTRVLLSHCTDTEFLETAFHGTPVICFPRNAQEIQNAARAVDLGFARSTLDMQYENSHEVANAVTQIHEAVVFRENARRGSLAIRDKINPAADRLIYWLRYMARMKNGNIEYLKPVSPARTSREDIQFFLGFLVGSLVTMIVILMCIIVTRRYVGLGARGKISPGRSRNGHFSHMYLYKCT